MPVIRDSDGYKKASDKLRKDPAYWDIFRGLAD
jgi:hypothetical protein